MMRPPAMRSGAPPGPENETAAELGGSGGGEISKKLASDFEAKNATKRASVSSLFALAAV